MKLHFIVFISFFFVVACQTAEKKPLELHRISGSTMGAGYDISYVGEELKNLQPDVEELLFRFNKSLSTYDSASVVSALNSNSQNQLDSLNLYVITKALQLHKATKGAFDITVAPLVNIWGFGVKRIREADNHKVDSVMEFVGSDKLETVNGMLVKKDPRITLNYNALAPGFAADLIAKLLAEKGCRNFMVNVGGEIVCRGKNQDASIWKIGVEAPAENQSGKNATQAVISVENRALATSGNYRQFYYKDGKRFAHTIDPRTGYPVQHDLLSATVLANDCITADALATACMVLGSEKAEALLKAIPGCDYYLILAGPDDTYVEIWSERLKGEF